MPRSARAPLCLPFLVSGLRLLSPVLVRVLMRALILRPPEGDSAPALRHQLAAATPKLAPPPFDRGFSMIACAGSWHLTCSGERSWPSGRRESVSHRRLLAISHAQPVRSTR